MKQLRNTLVGASVLALVGCAATQTVIEHGSLQASTRQSESLFLEPVSSSQKTVYVSVRNTSDENLNVEPELKSALSHKGYRIVKDLKNAHYLLQANVLRVGKMNASASHNALLGGYDSAIAGAVAGTAVGSFTHSTSGMVAGGLAGGVIGMAADALVKDVNYTMITDVQIGERVGKGVVVQEQTHSQLKNGTSTQISQLSSKNSEFKYSRVRIVSNADKVNLKFVDAKNALEKGLVNAIAGIF